LQVRVLLRPLDARSLAKLLVKPRDLTNECLFKLGPSGVGATHFQRALGAVDFVEGSAKLGHQDLVSPLVVLVAADAADGYRPNPPSLLILGDTRGVVT
jgi:hypothetical protein